VNKNKINIILFIILLSNTEIYKMIKKKERFVKTFTFKQIVKNYQQELQPSRPKAPNKVLFSKPCHLIVEISFLGSLF